MMDFLKSVAPMLATAIAGPLGGVAVKAIGEAIGMESATVDAVRKAVVGQQLTVEQVEAIKRAENDFALQMARLGFENTQALEQLAANDRANARQREISTGDWVPKVLAMFVTLGFFGVLLVLVFHGKPHEGGDALLVMLGSLGTAWTAIISYYYGSSSGSAAKTAMLAGRSNG